MTPHQRVAALAVIATCSIPAHRAGAELTSDPRPRGDARIVYVSDHASDMRAVLADSPTAAQLRDYVDQLADNGVDIFAQDVFQKQGSGWFHPEHPDHEHLAGPVDEIPEADGPPLAILIDQSHRRGMKFLGAFRMADRHGGSGSGLLEQRRDLWNPDFPDRAAMDYTHEEIHDWVYVLLEEILRRFDVDGFELTYTRWMHCFPRKTAEQSHPIMTDFVRRVRRLLDDASRQKGRRLILGARVPQTLEENRALGYDVATWAREGLVDYLAPCDFFFTDFNTMYETFAAITRGTDCMLYPAVHPGMCVKSGPMLMSPTHYRAAVRNMYAAGADGISQFNYQYHFARRRSSGYSWSWILDDYPQALAWLRQMRSDGRYDELPRHYLFLPLWGDGRAPSDAVKNDRIVLERRIGSHGEYRFRIAEDLTTPGLTAQLIVNAVSADGDRLAFELNGTPLPTGPIKTKRHGKGRADTIGRKMDPYRSYMIPLTSPPAVFGDNVLRAEVTALHEGQDSRIHVEELEVTILPPWQR